MKRVPVGNDDLARRAVREVVCPTCSQRSELAMAWNPGVPRRCERYCPIMINIETLLGMGAAHETDRLGASQGAVRARICQQCALTLSSGDYCAEFLARTCPLSRNAELLLAVMEKIVDGRERKEQKSSAAAAR